MTKIKVLNGSSLNMLGVRDLPGYGTVTLKDIEVLVREHAAKIDVEIDFRQTSSEAEMIDWIHDAFWNADGVILNPGGFARQSMAIHDAITVIAKPVVVVYLSNIFRKEQYKPPSYLSHAADSTVFGFGKLGYRFAMDGIVEQIRDLEQKAGQK